MPRGDGAPVEIEPVVGNLEALATGLQFAQHPQRLGSERFVDLPHADLVGSDTCTRDDLGHRSHRRDAHQARFQGVNRRVDDLGQWRDAELGNRVTADDDKVARSVGQRCRVAGGHLCCALLCG
jgi:hypothetical protein